MTDYNELRRLAAAATRARTAGRTVQDMADAIRFQDVCITAIPELLDALEAARKDASELRQSFDVRWEADMRAIKRWHDAGGDELTWPDHVELQIWLLEQLDARDSIIADLRRQLAGLGIPTQGETK